MKYFLRIALYPIVSTTAIFTFNRTISEELSAVNITSLSISRKHQSYIPKSTDGPQNK